MIEAYETGVSPIEGAGILSARYDDYGEDHYATLREPYEEVEFETPRLVRTPDASHRIEPAAAQPGPPHQGVPASSRVNAMARPDARPASADDNFGAGID